MTGPDESSVVLCINARAVGEDGVQFYEAYKRQTLTELELEKLYDLLSIWVQARLRELWK